MLRLRRLRKWPSPVVFQANVRGEGEVEFHFRFSTSQTARLRMLLRELSSVDESCWLDICEHYK